MCSDSTIYSSSCRVNKTMSGRREVLSVIDMNVAADIHVAEGWMEDDKDLTTGVLYNAISSALHTYRHRMTKVVAFGNAALPLGKHESFGVTWDRNASRLAGLATTCQAATLPSSFTRIRLCQTVQGHPEAPVAARGRTGRWFSWHPI
jgi:hypothetical protein